MSLNHWKMASCLFFEIVKIDWPRAKNFISLKSPFLAYITYSILTDLYGLNIFNSMFQDGVSGPISTCFEKYFCLQLWFIIYKNVRKKFTFLFSFFIINHFRHVQKGCEHFLSKKCQIVQPLVKRFIEHTAMYFDPLDIV